MGAGKSTVARVLGERLGRRVVDSDAVIEARTGRTVREIFETDGEPAFRTMETAALLDALDDPEPLVIAAAGGVVLREENRRALARPGVRVVWLAADPSVLVERVRSGGHRPALDQDPAGTLRRMHETREPLYREVADLIVSVDGRTVNDVVEAILR
ncbi:MAG: AAA family ATPase [Actinobacteria bacterium]|nr:AAA family ATPase [Actinomycetota bacterium]